VQPMLLTYQAVFSQSPQKSELVASLGYTIENH
jgi:hypothetical protein